MGRAEQALRRPDMPDALAVVGSGNPGVLQDALGVAGMVLLGAGIVFHEQVACYDAFVQGVVNGLDAGFVTHAARILSKAGPYLGAAMVLVALVIARGRGVRLGELRAPLMALTLALLCFEVLKLAVSRDRPFPLEPVQHDSFPSGDAAQVALCAATALHLLALRRIPRDWLGPATALVGATAAVAVGLARIYLGRHWVSDVAAGLLLGLVFWSAAPRWQASAAKLGLVVAGMMVLFIIGPRVVILKPRCFAAQRPSGRVVSVGTTRVGRGEERSCGTSRPPQRSSASYRAVKGTSWNVATSEAGAPSRTRA